MIELYLVSGNRKKHEEYTRILGGIRIIPVDLKIPEIQGEPEDIVLHKSKESSRILGKSCFVDDTSLSFNAWKGLPGPYIKDFIKRMSLEDIFLMLTGFSDKGAVASAYIGFCEVDKEPVIFSGNVSGRIVNPRGKTDFGWDPIFLPDCHEKTYAEMEGPLKDSISHRALASRKFKEYLLNRNP